MIEKKLILVMRALFIWTQCLLTYLGKHTDAKNFAASLHNLNTSCFVNILVKKGILIETSFLIRSILGSTVTLVFFFASCKQNDVRVSEFQKFRNCYDHLSKSIPFQTTFGYNTYDMVIKNFLMT